MGGDGTGCGDGYSRGSRRRRRFFVWNPMAAVAAARGAASDDHAAHQPERDRTTASGGGATASGGNDHGCSSGGACEGDGGVADDAFDDGGAGWGYGQWMCGVWASGDDGGEMDRHGGNRAEDDVGAHSRCDELCQDADADDDMARGELHDGDGLWGSDDVGRNEDDRERHGGGGSSHDGGAGRMVASDRGGDDILVFVGRARFSARDGRKATAGDSTRREEKGCDETTLQFVDWLKVAWKIAPHLVLPCERPFTPPLHQPTSTRWEAYLLREGGQLSTAPHHQPSTSWWEDLSPEATKPRHQPSTPSWEARTPEVSGSREGFMNNGGHEDTHAEMQDWPVGADSGSGNGCGSGTAEGDCSGDSVTVIKLIYLMTAVVSLVVLALLEASSACALAVWRLLGHVPFGGDGGTMNDNVAVEGVRPLPLRIRRRRVSRRGPRGEPAYRVRAVCRRMEAFVCIWLTMSSHLLTVQATLSRIGQAGATTGPERVRERRLTGAEGDPLRGCDGDRARDVVMAVALTSRRSPCNVACDKRRSDWWTSAYRVGEASNPGPSGATLATHGILRKVYSTAKKVLTYPRPGSGALRRTVAPGYDNGGQQRAEEADEFTLTIEAINTTGWRGLQRRMLHTDSHVLLAQETWLTQDALPAASAWARRNGWQTIWTAAVPGPQGGASGGAAILVREGIGLRYPPGGSHVWWPGRVVAAMIDAPAHRPLLVVSSYLVHGVGPTAENLEILAAIGQRISTIGHDHEFVIGGDMNMEPPDMAAVGFEQEVDAVIMSPVTTRGTYRSSRASSLIDFFIVSNRTAAAVERVEVIEGTGAKGHVPIRLAFKARATTLRALHLRRPPRLGRERVYGPLPPPPDWGLARKAAEDALAAARGNGADVQELMDRAYRSWADLAEEELADFVGEVPKKWGGKRAATKRRMEVGNPGGFA